jgi:alpha-galactosidase
MNRDLTTAGSGERAAYRVQVEACYHLMDRLRAHRPQVEIEACSSGGARADFGVLHHAHRLWTSDCNDARSRLGIQRGALQFFPPEILGAHIGPAPAHTTGRSQSLDFRAAVALPCHLGVEADLRRMDDAQRERLASWIALYKTLRPRLHGVPVIQGEAGDGVFWQAHGDADSALLFIYRLDPTGQRYSPSMRLPWVDDTRRYRLRRVDTALLPHIPGWGDSPLHDALSTNHGALLDGAWLRHAGLQLPRLTGESALILSLESL